MDQYTRRIIGFGIHAGIVDGRALCRMFNRAIRWEAVAKYLSSDHDPLYRFHQWQANLRILDIKEIKTVPYVPLSHPFIERLIRTIRRECLDQSLFWNGTDLEMKLLAFRSYYNGYRTHACLKGKTPIETPNPKASVSSHFAGRNIVAVYTKHQLQHDYEFARHRCERYTPTSASRYEDGGTSTTTQNVCRRKKADVETNARDLGTTTQSCVGRRVHVWD
jgi:hypothetical protein